jgi:adenine-specific DNA-methyltransferase
VNSFTQLFSSAAEQELPLILSYPSEGLLSAAGSSVAEAAAPFMQLKNHESFGANHSTLGASKGATTKSATENLYVYTPN